MMLRCVVGIVLAAALIPAHTRAEEGVPVTFAGETLFHLRHPADALTVQERAAAVHAALQQAVTDYAAADFPTVDLTFDGTLALLSVGDVPLLRVYPQDLSPDGPDLLHLAERWRIELEAVLLKAMPPVLDLSTPPATEGEPGPTTSAEDGLPVPIALGDTVIARIRFRAEYPTIAGRAAAVNARLAQVLAACREGCTAPVSVTEIEGCPAVCAGDHLIVRVSPEDAAANDSTPDVLAAQWCANLAQALAAVPAERAAADSPDHHDPNLTDGSVIDVMLSSAVIARIRARGTADSVRERGAIIDGRITDIISSEDCSRPDVRIVDDRGVPAIYVGSRLLMHVYAADAEPNGCTPARMAASWRKNLLEWLPRAASMAARPRSAAGSATADADPLIGDAGRANLPPGAHTGLIIDATGMRALRSMHPQIVGPDGREVWGTVRCSAAWALATGTAAWAHGLDQARRNERAGDNPLVIRATSVTGPARSIVQVSAHDARRIRAADRVAAFLAHCNIVIAQ